MVLDKKIAMKHLEDPMLLQRLVLDGLDEVIAGEDAARKIIFICSMGRLVINANATSYNLLVNSTSGAGKDHVVNNVMKLLPEYAVHKRTRISPKALTYWHNAKFEPNWTWDGKVLYLEDCSNEVFNSEVFKVFTSNGSHATIVKDQRAIDIEIKGKPVVIVTSASANPHPELVRRFLVVNLNETPEQTQEVMMKWADHAVKGEVPKVSNLYMHSLEYLMPKRVKIPWAKKLLKYLPIKNVIMRTQVSRLVDFIKASTVLFQYQREKDSDEFLLADQQDYEIAKDILLNTTCNERFVPLTQVQQEILTLIKEMGMNKTDDGERETGWTANELVSKMPIARSQFYELINKLVKDGFVEKSTERDSYTNKPYAVYWYKKQEKLTLPTWEEVIG